MSSCGTSVLVVDDHPDTAKMVTTALRRRGLDVHTVQSGEDALRLLAVLKPQVVVMDEMMPGITGLEVLSTMRSTTDLKQTKVVFYSASYDIEKQKTAVGLGVAAWMVKGVSRLGDLVTKVEQLCTDQEPN